QELKLRKAKQLLVGTSQSVKEISFFLGFQSTEYFFSFFKKRTGLTPLEYRSFGREE
ncbi:helix-turn-helix domain-containing protein, partial [Bacteroides acidifaciens]